MESRRIKINPAAFIYAPCELLYTDKYIQMLSSKNPRKRNASGVRYCSMIFMSNTLLRALTTACASASVSYSPMHTA